MDWIRTTAGIRLTAVGDIRRLQIKHSLYRQSILRQSNSHTASSSGTSVTNSRLSQTPSRKRKAIMVLRFVTILLL